MRIAFILSLVLALQGCAAVTAVQKYWPRDHDPALAYAYVQTKIGVDSVSSVLGDAVTDMGGSRFCMGSGVE